MGPTAVRPVASSIALAAVLLAACGGGDPAPSTPTRTPEATPRVEATARVEATESPSPAPLAATPEPEPFVVATNPTDVELRPATSESSGSRATSFLYRRETDELWEFSEPIDHWRAGHPESPFILSVRSAERAGSVLLIDPLTLEIVELALSGTVDELRWLSPTLVQASIVPPNGSAPSPHILDLETLLATPIDQAVLNEPARIDLDGAHLDLWYDGMRSYLRTEARVADIGVLASTPSISPDGTRLLATRLRDGRVLAAEAPSWEVHESTVTGLQDRGALVSWSSDSAYAAVVGSGGIWMIGPQLNDVSLLRNGFTSAPWPGRLTVAWFFTSGMTSPLHSTPRAALRSSTRAPCGYRQPETRALSFATHARPIDRASRCMR